MAKRKKDGSEAAPTASNVDWPVFVPSEDGSTDIEVGRARLRFGTLVVEFTNSRVSVAVQKMIERGVLMGFGMIMLKPDVVNEMYQDVVKNEEAVAAATEKAIVAGILRRNDDGKVESINPDQTVDEVLTVFLHFDEIVAEAPVENNTFKIVAESDELDQILSQDKKENN